MNTIPKDPYADALLLEMKVSIAGALITRDAYADGLLNNIHDGARTFQFPIDNEAPAHIALKDVEKKQ